MPTFSHPDTVTSTSVFSSSRGSSNNGGRRGNNRLVYLLDILDRIQTATDISVVERYMHAFTKELLQVNNKQVSSQTSDNSRSGGGGGSTSNSDSRRHSYGRTAEATATSTPTTKSTDEVTLFIKGDETMLQDLESRGVLTILLRTMVRCLQIEQSCRHDLCGSLYDVDVLGRENENIHQPSLPYNNRPNNQQHTYCRVSPQFFNSACIALVHFCFQSHHRSRTIFENGGFNVIVDVMRTYRFVDYVQIIGMAAIMVLGQIPSSFPTQSHCVRNPYNNSNQCSVYSSVFVNDRVLEQIVLALEFHPNNGKLYTVACSALSTLLGGSQRKPESVSTDGGSRLSYRDRLQRMIKKDLVDTFCSSNDLLSSVRNHFFERALTAVAYGTIIHASDDPMTLSIGEILLFTLMGRPSAEKMIMDVEQKCYGLFGAAAA